MKVNAAAAASLQEQEEKVFSHPQKTSAHRHVHALHCHQPHCEQARHQSSQAASDNAANTCKRDALQQHNDDELLARPRCNNEVCRSYGRRCRLTNAMLDVTTITAMNFAKLNKLNNIDRLQTLPSHLLGSPWKHDVLSQILKPGEFVFKYFNGARKLKRMHIRPIENVLKKSKVSQTAPFEVDAHEHLFASCYDSSKPFLKPQYDPALEVQALSNINKDVKGNRFNDGGLLCRFCHSRWAIINNKTTKPALFKTYTAAQYVLHVYCSG